MTADRDDERPEGKRDVRPREEKAEQRRRRARGATLSADASPNAMDRRADLARRPSRPSTNSEDEETSVITITEPVRPEIRIWRVAHAMHANIPRSVVRQPVSLHYQPDARAPRPSRRELLDLSLNIVNLFVPPKTGAVDHRQPVKCFRGYCSVFAARHHEQFMHDFIDELAETGGAIETPRIRTWIVEVQRAPIALAPGKSFAEQSVAASG